MRGWLFGAAGLLLIVLGTIGVAFESSSSRLSGLAVGAPTPAMVAMAVGSGGRDPTTVFPAAMQATGVPGPGYVPTSPTIYLSRVHLTNLRVPIASQAAYWKVWWDDSSRIQADVCLQQHATSSDASAALARLVVRNSDAGNFASPYFHVDHSSSFGIPGLDGATAELWDGSIGPSGQSVPMEFRFVVLQRGSVLALVSMTAYSTLTDPNAFAAFAQAEYSKMAGAPSFNMALVFSDTRMAGLGLIVVGLILLLVDRRSRRPAVPVPGQMPWPPWGPPPVWPPHGHGPWGAPVPVTPGPLGPARDQPWPPSPPPARPPGDWPPDSVP